MTHMLNEMKEKQIKVKISTGDWTIETIMLTPRLRNTSPITDSLELGCRDGSEGKGACCHD